ncbi:protein-L-isoaspartate(D-aspartate) O-methyltransferase [Patescibacteria group bacterium]|nr:protein-L-isoaspartate(D-aspartate) O-methyltransferase [Patescibacteria group bacterium]
MNKQKEMVSVIRDSYGLDSPGILSAMLTVPRERFAPKKYKRLAYDDGSILIGMGQTMSQPYTVAFMTDLLISAKNKAQSAKVGDWEVLEIGTGSGYQAAILSRLVSKVYTVEIIDKLAKRAKKVLKKLGYDNVHVKSGSGEWGWKKYAPYDAIIVTCGVEEKIPQELFVQLKVGGVLVAPVGKGYDKAMMKYVKKSGGRFKKEKHGIFHFVPFIRGKK